MCVKNGESRPDTKGRGGFRFDGDTIGYNCFNCGYSAKWQPGAKISHRFRGLLETLGADRAEIQRMVLRNMESYEFQENQQKDRFQIDWKEIELPENSRHLMSMENLAEYPNAVSALKLLVDRELDFHSDWYYSTHWKYRNRMILPLRYNNKIVGYTARDLFQNNKFKYLSNIPKNFVSGLDRQTAEKKCIIVTEGYFDGLMTDGVAIGSNNINDNQADIIEDLDKRIIVLPDRNRAGARLAQSAIDRDWEVSFPPWESDVIDANDAVLKYGRYFMVKSVLEFAVSNSTKAKVLMKQTCKG